MSLSTRKSSFSSRLTLVLQSLKSTTLVFCLCGQSLDSILQLNQLPPPAIKMSDATTFYSMYSLFFLSRFLLRLFREIQFRSLEAFFRSQGHLLIGRRQVSIYRLEPLGSKSLSKIHSHLPFLAFNY